MAYFGENLLISHSCEENVCVGDIIQINDTMIEISQPRQPCWKLSSNTKINDMANSLYKHALTGWYGRVIKEGTINQNDMVLLKQRNFPELTIAILNQLMVNPTKNPVLVEQALSCDSLGKAFKSSLKQRYKNDSYEHLSYQT